MKTSDNVSDSSAPLYQQIVDYFVNSINCGMFAAGYRLPTVRAYAKEQNIALGTVKHAYDILEQLGYIEKVQGRGCFVSNINEDRLRGKKSRAMAAIDTLLNQLIDLGFSPEEIRIFLDLKLREREELPATVHLGAIDCCPETLSAMCRQINAFPNVDVYEYLLKQVLEASHEFSPELDMIVTTSTHFDDLAKKMPEGAHIFRLYMAISRNTLLQLARIPVDFRVGIIAATQRYANIIINCCKEYGLFVKPPMVALFSDTDSVENLVEQCDQLILPSNYLNYCSPKEQALLNGLKSVAPPIYFEYHVDKGSMLALEDEISKVFRQKQAGIKNSSNGQFYIFS